jgi:hypothetical protein
MEAVEQRRPLGGWPSRPACERASGGCDSAVHIVLIAERDFGDRLLGRRVDDARRGRSDRLPPDIERATS